MSSWFNNDDASRDRYSHPCSTCTGSGEHLRYELKPCECVYRCSDFCSMKREQLVHKRCDRCHGSGVAI